MSTSQQPTGPKADPPAESPPTRARPLPKTQPGEGGLRRLPGVVLFAAGKHTPLELGPDLGTLRQGQQREFPPDYLGRVVQNFAALKADAEFHHEPPAVIGHERVQAKLAEILSGDDTYQKVFADAKATSGGGPGRTDQPAAGWWDNLRLDGDGRMVADLERIPPSVGDMIDRGELRFPSVEFKESAVRQDGTPVGPFLFRVALLGGTPPACKSVPPLGQAHFADLPEGVVAFADAVPDQTPADVPDKPMLALLQKCHPNLSSAFLATLSRKQLDQLAADYVAADGQGDASGRDALIQAYVKAGLGDETSAAQMTDDQLRTALSAAGVTAMADSLNQTTSAAVTTTATADLKVTKPMPLELAAFADAIEARVTAKFADREKELDAKAEAIRKAAESAQKSIDARAFAEWSETVDRAVDAGVKANKIPPSQADPMNPRNIRARLKAIPADEVFVFADAQGNEVREPRRKTELDALNDLPVRMFGDRIGVTDAKSKDDPLAALEERSKKFAEDQNKRLAASYQRN